MLGIIANFVAYVLFGVLMTAQSRGVQIFLVVVIFALISFGFTYSQSARAESGSCLYSLLMRLNEIASGVMLLILAGFGLMQCGIF